MNKVAQYLQQHLNGEIVTSPDALRYFSTDESIFQLTPLLVVYPRSENDVRKTARFTWQLAEKGRVVPITPRGMGTDQTGGSLGSGIILAMPAHLNKVIELDPKTGVVSVESGMTLDKLQQVLHTHGRFLPPVSDVNKNATVGGSVSNNDSGRESYKYGPMQAYVRSLRVVLANGELVETGRISKRELNKKLGLASFEGEIYRSLDKLIEESSDSIAKLSVTTDHSAAGYDISDVKQKDGSFDITPLFVGAQGTLGTIVEVTFDTKPYNPTRELIVAGFADRAQGWQAVSSINTLKEGPSAIDFVDITLLQSLEKINPAILNPLEGAMPGILLFMELDDEAHRTRKKIEKKLSKILNNAGAEIVKPKEAEIEGWLRLRDSASLYLTHTSGKKRAIPVLDDGQVPLDRMTEFFKELDGLMVTAGLEEYAAWGQAGTGLIHVAPMLDITSVGDRQKLFKVMDAYYGYICTIGGSITGEYAEGRMRGLYNTKQFDEQSMSVFNRIKKIFDPLGIYNPNVKLDVKLDQLKAMIRTDYTLDHQYNHLPRG
jgi:FAD/FMN-containing dehydrogenase